MDNPEQLEEEFPSLGGAPQASVSGSLGQWQRQKQSHRYKIVQASCPVMANNFSPYSGLCPSL